MRPAVMVPMLTLTADTRDRSAGFSLLEVLVSIAIIATLTGIVTVNAQAVLERTRYEQNIHDARTLIQKSRVHAMRSSRTIRLADTASTIEFDFEPGKFEFSKDAEVFASGACSGGLVQIGPQGSAISMAIEPLTCNLVIPGGTT